jgi:hypothetical protein
MTGTLVVAKIFDHYSEKMDLVEDEILLNQRLANYAWTPFPQYMDAFPTNVNDQFMIVFREIIGWDLSYELIRMASLKLRETWFIQVIFALCCCHMCSIFHQDLADMVSLFTLNVRIDTGYKIFVIDFGDGQHPLSRAEYMLALQRDINGVENLATRIFDGYAYGRASIVMSELKRVYQDISLSVYDTRFAFYRALQQVQYMFPAGFGGFYQTMQ